MVAPSLMLQVSFGTELLRLELLLDTMIRYILDSPLLCGTFTDA
jgi:hypothetical protein